MADSLIFSFNVVMPIVLLVLVGIYLKKINFLNESYCTIADKLVFNVALPLKLVGSLNSDQLKDADLGVIFSGENLRVSLFFFVGIVVAFVLMCVCAVVFMKDNTKRSVFVQGAVRGNYAIFALPLVENMFGDAGKTAASLLLPVVIIMYNVLAVIAFTVFIPRGGEKKSIGKVLKQIVISTLKNPLIIGVFVGFAVFLLRSETGVGVPTFLMKVISDIAALAVPLSLISIGVSFDPSTLKNGLGVSVWCMVMKNIALPAIALAVGILMGFRDISLALILISFGGPTAVSSYIMAKNMHGDAELASKILLLTTVCSLGTIFMFIFILKQFAFI